MSKITKKIFIGPIFLVFMVLILIYGCGIRPSLTPIKTGPMQTEEITIPLPAHSQDAVDLYLEFMAGELKLSPGATNSLLIGNANFNTEIFEPIIENHDPSFTLHQANQDFENIPIFGEDVKNEWDLQLADIPMNLSIKAGAYTGHMELGGLSLKSLHISEGGSDFSAAFSDPNHVEMSTLTYSTGGSKMVMKGLANANFTKMDFSSGAGDYTLGFDGDLKRDADVFIKSGAGTVTLIVPKGVNAVVTFEGGLTSIKNTGWSQDNNVYTLSGSGPVLRMVVEMGMGTLNLMAE